MNRLFANSFTCVLIGVLSLLATAQNPSGKQWIGTWATAPQPPEPGHVKNFRNQTLRLIVHISTGGTRVRIKISNTFGDHPLVIGGAHIARRKDVADIDPKSDRTLTFEGKSSTTVAAGTMVVSDPVALEAPALSDLAVSLFLPESTEVKSLHVLALQTSYVSQAGDARFFLLELLPRERAAGSFFILAGLVRELCRKVPPEPAPGESGHIPVL